MKFMLGAALALAVAACGDNAARRGVCGDLVCELDETADSCAEDCGCGNGIANPGEDCDATDFGGATCESAAQRGGTLGCNADCTFDLTRCDEYMCGNGIVEPGEECDGTDVGGATCASAGFSAGALGCTASCRFDATACCNNFCETANTSVCAGDTVEHCVMQASGCLGVEVTDCGAADDVCDDSGATATCVCVDRCSAVGVGHCAGAVAETCEMQADGCLAYSADTNCATSGDACAVGPQGATCVAAATGENCADPYPLVDGQNVIGWNATASDYLTLTSQTSCNTTTFVGPDVVLAYTATVDGIVTYSLSKQASQRHVVVTSSAACGTVTAATDISCVADTTATRMGDTFAVSQGTVYYFYVQDTSTGTAPLPSPMVIDLDETACTTITNTPTNLSPANGTLLTTSVAPVVSFDLPHPIKTNAGVITITGNLGTSLTYNLAATPAPTQVTFVNGGRTVQINPAVSFMPGETITVTWSGLVDNFCGAAIPSPTWTFNLMTPTCTPGAAGMVGTTMTRRATGIGSFTENYVYADEAATGYVYVGGTTELYRVPKAGGAFQDVSTAAGITSTPLGYSVLVIADRIFTLDTVTATTSPFLWRLSTSNGLTWNPLGYAQYPTTAGASSYSMVNYKGTIYIATNETTAGAGTQIWSVSPSAVSLPTQPVLVGTITGAEECDSLAIDDFYFYLTCDDDDRIVRASRTTFQAQLITGAIPLNVTKNELRAHDTTGDGRADVLYVKNDDETVRYICGPGASGPFWHGILVDFGGTATTSNYGLGFDPVANVLWAYDDDTQELISIQ
jgi:hypothetical protein